MSPRPVFFGAFDRHNLGDILLAHVAAAGADKPRFAGLAARDLRPCGGQQVDALDSIHEPITLIHVGGELLDCDTEQAAFMLGEPTLRWIRRAPYVVPRQALPAGSRTVFQSVGGVDLAQRDPAFRAEVIEALRQAESLFVRDRATQFFLASAGIAAVLQPDPVTRIAELFGASIQARRPKGGPYLAVQFAAECGDDATLAAFARGLDRIGLPVTFFRAGAAPWHDDLEPYRRLASRLSVPSKVFASLEVWDICALIAGSQGFIGTSLHGRLVAQAFGLPALSLERAPGAGEKLRAYLQTWQPEAQVLSPDAFADDEGKASTVYAGSPW